MTGDPASACSPAASDLSVVKAAIRTELAADGATQADLARYLGVSQKHVSRVLNGRQPGSPGFIEAMAHACGLTLTAAGMCHRPGPGTAP